MSGDRRAGRVSRRALLKGALAALAVPTAACFRREEHPSRLTVSQSADPASLNPLLQTGLVEASVYANVFDSLVALDAAGRLQPSLAESWEVRDDRSLVLRLRSGVTFHNGEPFEAQSVRFTVERVLDPATGSPIRAQLDAIERVETPDARTAIVVTKRPFAPLLAELTTLMMLPPGHTAKVGMDGLDREPVGTGPFRLVERVKGDLIVLEASGQHWRGRPAVGRVEFRTVPDTASRLAAVQAGQVDLATGAPADQVDVLQRGGVQIVGRPGIQTLYVRLNTRKPPLDDLRVRRAIAHAVDWDQIIATVYDGRARRVNGPFPAEVFGYDPNAAVEPYDPARARTLLREAGLGDGAQLVLDTPRRRYPKDDQVAEVIAGYLGEVGLRTTIKVLEWGAYLEKIQAGQGEHLFLLAGTNRTFDPHFTIARLYTSAAALSKPYYVNSEVDRLAGPAAGTVDVDRRREMYRQILALLRADIPALWIAQLDDLYAKRPHVTWEPRADSLLWLHPARLGGRA